MGELLDYGVRPPGYRLPDAVRLGSVVFQVSDLGRSMAYYREVVGLDVLRTHGTTAVLGPRGSAPEAPGLIELRERRGARPVPRRGRLGLFHVALLVPNRPALGRVLRHLLEAGERPGMSDHFVSEALYLYDPDGLGLEIYADRPRSIWRAEGRQLYMTTEPLDVAEVLAAAQADRGAEPPTGLPPGTVVGHVHLSVDDLSAASHFYHEGVGFDRTVWTYPGALFMSAGGYHHHLGTNTWATGAPLATDEDARLLAWQIVLPTAVDVAAATTSLASAGHPARSGVVTDPWGVGVVLTAEARPTR